MGTRPSGPKKPTHRHPWLAVGLSHLGCEKQQPFGVQENTYKLQKFKGRVQGLSEYGRNVNKGAAQARPALS